MEGAKQITIIFNRLVKPNLEGVGVITRIVGNLIYIKSFQGYPFAITGDQIEGYKGEKYAKIGINVGSKIDIKIKSVI